MGETVYQAANYAFEDFELDTLNGELRKAGELASQGSPVQFEWKTRAGFRKISAITSCLTKFRCLANVNVLSVNHADAT